MGKKGIEDRPLEEDQTSVVVPEPAAVESVGAGAQGHGGHEAPREQEEGHQHTRSP